MRGFGLLFVLVALLCGGALLDARRSLEAPLALGAPQMVEIPPGTPFGAVIDDWRNRGWFASSRQGLYLQVFARATGVQRAVRAGEYELPVGSTPLSALLLVTSGKTVQHEIVIVEGWRFDQALAAVLAHPKIRRTLEDTSPDKVMDAIGFSGLYAEGRLLPETYNFPAGTTDVDFLRRAFSSMQRALDEEWASRAKGLPYTDPDQALIMASIIERETGVPSERGAIAGVFVRRLQSGMRLQTDPTVIYGLGATFDGNLTRAHLETDSPYNTYTRPGLPPTPICLPGRAAIVAALQPAAGNALYFVARGDGTHQFSATLAEHQAAVRRYQLGRQ